MGTLDQPGSTFLEHSEIPGHVRGLRAILRESHEHAQPRGQRDVEA